MSVNLILYFVEQLLNIFGRGVEYVGTGEPGSQALFFCQALFDNLSRFMCFLGIFLEKKSRFMSLFWQNVAIYALLGTFLGKML